MTTKKRTALTDSMIAKLYCEAYGIDQTTLTFPHGIPHRVRESSRSFTGYACDILFASHFQNYATMFSIAASNVAGVTCLCRWEGDFVKVSCPYSHLQYRLAQAEAKYKASGLMGEIDDYLDPADREAYLYSTQN